MTKTLNAGALLACATCADVIATGVAFTWAADSAARSIEAVDRAYDLGAALRVDDLRGYSSHACELCGETWAGDRFTVRVSRSHS